LKRIGILSDTHGFLNEEVFSYFEECHEIWHAGDIGTIEVADRLASFRSFKAVYGNIDNHTIRISYPQIQRFMCEDTEVLIKHIVGYPGKYDPGIRETLSTNPPKLLIAGHSHILKVQFDKRNNFLFINPGAAGKSGFHKVSTLVRLTIDGSVMKDLEVIELR
jgi:putative phosphoesterase